MKAHNLLAGLALISALPMSAADVVPDVLTLDNGQDMRYWNQAVLSSVGSIEITVAPRTEGLNGSVMVFDKYTPSNPSDPIDERMYQRGFAIKGPDGTSILKGTLTFRPAGKLAMPYFINSGCKLEGFNNINLEWSPIEGASGYELTWEEHLDNLQVKTVSLEGTNYSLPGCAYQSSYNFKVRAIHPTDPELSSDFSGRGNFSPTPTYTLTTWERYEVPTVLSLMKRAKDSFTVTFDLNCYEDKYKENFEVVDGKFVADKVRLMEYTAEGNIITEHELTDADKEAGTKTFTDLTPGATYAVALVNSSKPAADAPYNTCIVNLLGEPTEVSAESLDRWFELYTDGVPDLKYYLDCFNDGLGGMPSEGSTINLSGDKTYVLTANADLFKGITFRTDPADAAAGKHAVIDMATKNFNISKNEQGTHTTPVLIGKISFENIDFVNTGAQNYGDGSATGNYFINCYSNGNVGHEFESMEFHGCTFTGIIRGFVRLQGSAIYIFDHLIFDGCLFYDCGYYDKDGRGYEWFAGAGRPDQNLYKDFQFTNNTIYDSPRGSLLTDNNKQLLWDEDSKWNIKIENNTFVNFSTRSTGRYLLNMRYFPEGSKISIQRNLFVLATDDPTRELNNAGADIRTAVTHEIKDNYSVGCRPEHLVNDGIFTAAPFSATKNSFGAYPEANLGTADDLVVKVGSTPLLATDLFTAPNPPADHKAPADIMNALKYKQTPEVLNHEIYTKSIGDPRWRN